MTPQFSKYMNGNSLHIHATVVKAEIKGVGVVEDFLKG